MLDRHLDIVLPGHRGGRRTPSTATAPSAATTSTLCGAARR
jgi:hypothetical protein